MIIRQQQLMLIPTIKQGVRPRLLLALFVIITICAASPQALATGDYLSEAEFLEQAFGSNPPEAQQYYLRRPDKEQAQIILGHRFKPFRVRYWQQQQRSAWVLEEIGKERPITMGIVVEANQIERIRVLTFRESRGWEVRYPAFTQQFEGASLDNKEELNQTINGISGATLSVNAMRSVARLALFLHQQIIEKIE